MVTLSNSEAAALSDDMWRVYSRIVPIVSRTYSAEIPRDFDFEKMFKNIPEFVGHPGMDWSNKNSKFESIICHGYLLRSSKTKEVIVYTHGKENEKGGKEYFEWLETESPWANIFYPLGSGAAVAAIIDYPEIRPEVTASALARARLFAEPGNYRPYTEMKDFEQKYNIPFLFAWMVCGAFTPQRHLVTSTYSHVLMPITSVNKSSLLNLLTRNVTQTPSWKKHDVMWGEGRFSVGGGLTETYAKVETLAQDNALVRVLTYLKRHKLGGNYTVFPDVPLFYSPKHYEKSTEFPEKMLVSFLTEEEFEWTKITYLKVLWEYLLKIEEDLNKEEKEHV